MTLVAVSIQRPLPTGGNEEQMLTFISWALIAVIVAVLVCMTAQLIGRKRKPNASSNGETSPTVGTTGQDHQ